MEIDRQIIRAAQELWKSRGYYSGAIDGIWGPLSLKAYQKYVESQNPPLPLPVKGDLSSLITKPIVKKPTKNHGGKHVPHTIVLHYCAGTWEGTQSWVTNPASQVSYHYYVSEKGEIVEFVPHDTVAWHVRGHNTGYIGIAVQGNTSTGQYRNGRKELNSAEIDSVVQLIQGLSKLYNIKNITTHRALDPSRRSDISPLAEKQILEALKQRTS